MSAPRVVGIGHLPRFAQLTYASTDRDGHARGWQVQDTAGGLTSTERNFLTRQIVTRFTPAADVSAYLAADEVRALPRRLVYAPGPGGAAAFWHTAPCGSDAQGRPGNVFVHVLLDRAAHRAGPAPERPSDLCGSPHWLRPFGPDEVAAAALDDVPEPPWEPALGRADVLSFLFGAGPPDVGVFCLLLDAVYAAMGGGPTVAFGVHTEESARHWIATIDHVMSPGAARRFYWSTSERLAERHSWPAGVHLVVVPYEEVAGCGPLEHLVLIGEDEQVRRADPGRGPRMTRNGSPVAVTAWSAMAYEVSALPEHAAVVLSELGRVAAQVGDVGLDPAWPMAMVLATMPDEFADAMTTARWVLETQSPPHLAANHPELYASVLALAAGEAGSTTEDAWKALRHAAAGPWRAVLRDLYLLRALGDENWLARPGAPGAADPVTVPVPESPVADAVRKRAAHLVRSLHRRIRDDTVTSGLAEVGAVVVRVTDIVRSYRIDLEQDGRRPTRLDDLWTWVVDRVVSVPGPRERLLDVLAGQVGTAAQDEFARTLTQRLRVDRGRAGTRVPVAVHELLGTRLPRPSEFGSRGAPTPLQRELAACLTLVDPDPWSLSWLVRMWDLLDHGDDRDELARLLGAEETGRPGHLAVLLGHPRHAPVLDLVRRTVLRARPGADTGDLVAAVLRAGALPMGLRAAAELRQIADQDSDAPAGRVRLMALVDQVLADVIPGAVTPSVWRAVLAAYTAEMVHRAWHQYPETADEHLPPPVVQALRGQAAEPGGIEWSARVLAGCSDVPDAALVYAALCLQVRGEDLAASGSRLRRLATIVVTGQGVLSIVDRAVALRHRDRRLTASSRDDGLHQFRQELRNPERARAWLRFAGRSEDTDADAICRTWWAQVTATGSHTTTNTGPTAWRGGY